MPMSSLSCERGAEEEATCPATASWVARPWAPWAASDASDSHPEPGITLRGCVTFEIPAQGSAGPFPKSKQQDQAD